METWYSVGRDMLRARDSFTGALNIVFPTLIPVPSLSRTTCVYSIIDAVVRSKILHPNDRILHPF